MLPQKRKIPSTDLAWDEDDSVSQELPQSFLVAGYDLYIEGELLVAGGSSSSFRSLIDRS